MKEKNPEDQEMKDWIMENADRLDDQDCIPPGSRNLSQEYTDAVTPDYIKEMIKERQRRSS